MIGGLFKGLRSNRAISSAHPPSIQVQDQMKALRRMQELNQKNAKVMNKVPDFDSRNQEMLRKNQEMLRR
jgi:ribosome maturation protein Sdo1